ncbi:response regulator [Pseudomonas syringae]|uniref:response regulator n=1 Tax=Pseudomonas syringae TaxID=317 RepID=UPI000516927C|nr:response regulator [Pseudomonas syringae]
MRPTVLLVEDDHILRLLAVDALSMLDTYVIACCSADEALTVLEDSKAIGLVFTDIRMPGRLDGLQLAALVAERWPHLSILVTSGNRLAGDALPPQALFLAKPWTLDILFKSVQALLPDPNELEHS